MRVETDVERAYLDWLYSHVSVNGTDGLSSRYHNLMGVLQSRDFYWTVSRDDNRAADGRSLRSHFSSVTGLTETDFTYRPCSVLEMMVALASRMENDFLYDYRKPDRTNVWFYRMIKHMGLSECTDENWDDDCLETAHHAIDILLDRSYRKDGKGGGLFPLRLPKRDQTKIEIWDQMNDYLVEKMQNSKNGRYFW